MQNKKPTNILASTYKAYMCLSMLVISIFALTEIPNLSGIKALVFGLLATTTFLKSISTIKEI